MIPPSPKNYNQMRIYLTGPLKNLVDNDTLTIPDCRDTGQLATELRKSVPGIHRVPYRIAVNGRIITGKYAIREGDRLELISLLQGG
jgi:hypothetical protein